MMDEDLQEDRIRERAYQLWLEAGEPEGGDQDFWYIARKQLEEEDTPAPEVVLPPMGET